MCNTGTVTILFIGSLNDFLKSRYKDRLSSVPFCGNPAIKDIIESLGVPHVEVKQILVNSTEVGFFYHIQNTDFIKVYPFEYGPLPSGPERPHFVLDVHLGKLARTLRMMGFDSVYRNDFSDPQLVSISCNENRIVLTRDIGILKYRCLRYGYWVRSTLPIEQAKEIASHYQLCALAAPFSVCMECNGPLINICKSLIENKLEPLTRVHYHNFSQCVKCRKIYWHGSHFQNMNTILKQICPKLN